MTNTKSSMRILIAEDDLTSRNMLAAVLKNDGHQVLETVDGAEAWREMQRPGAPLLAILDWMMPEMDGVQVIGRIRAMRYPQPPYIIMLTSKGEKADVVAGLNAGADDYLAKPFDVDELRARVEVGRRMIEIQAKLAKKMRELQAAFEQIKTLRGIVPICMHCKKIRDDQGYWSQVEVYVRDHSEAEFSHAICPGCIRELYPGVTDETLDDSEDLTGASSCP